MTNDMDDTARNGIAVERFYASARHAAEPASGGIQSGMGSANGANHDDRYGECDMTWQQSHVGNRNPMVDKNMHDNIVVCTAASGGIGLSVLAAMLAWEMTDRGHRCALVDADFAAGGLDVLLGIEHDRGTRFEEVEAPLGHIEGSALNQELPVWQDAHVLAYDSWGGDPPQWWEVQAAVDALASVNDVVIVDAGFGRSQLSGEGLPDAYRIVAMELSVLGLARAKTYIANIIRKRSKSGDDADGTLGLVGIYPRGATKARRLLDVNEASEYLGHEVVGPIRHHTKLQYEILEGIGITGIPRAQRRTIERLASGIEQALGGLTSGKNPEHE